MLPVTPDPAAPIVCPNCGFILPGYARFCRRCGHELAAPVGDTHPMLQENQQTGSLISAGTSIVRRVSAALSVGLPETPPHQPPGFQGNLTLHSPDVFISYSRKDKAFVQHLAQTLEEAKRQAWVDWQDIPPTAKWLEEIYMGIEAATTFIFVLSPDSIVSETCMKEVAHAIENKKRIIPLVCRPIDRKQVVDSLRELNWIYFTPEDIFDQALRELIFSLDTDLVYWKQAARLLIRAKEWENKGHDAAIVLRGQDLKEADNWLTEGATKQPSPNKLQTEFITASRRIAATHQRRTIGVLAVTSVVLAGLTVLSFVLYQLSQMQEVQVQHDLTVTTAHEYASESNFALFRNQTEKALLLGVKGYNTYNDLETRDTLYNAITENIHLDAIFTDETQLPSWALNANYMNDAVFSPAEQALISISIDDRVTRWDLITHQQRLLFQTSDQDNLSTQIQLSPDGSKIALFVDSFSSPDKVELQLRNAYTGEIIWTSPISKDALGHNYLAFSSGGTTIEVTSKSSDGSQVQFSRTSVSSGQIIGKPMALSFSSNWSFAATAMSPDSIHWATLETNSQNKQEAEIDVWDSLDNSLVWEGSVPTGNTITAAFSPDGSRLLSTEDTHVQIWDAGKGKTLSDQTSALAVITASAFSPDGQRIALGGCIDLGCTQGRLELSTAEPSEIAQFPVQGSIAGHINGILDLSFSPDGNYMVTVDGSNHLFVWNTNTSSSYHLFAPLSTAGSDLLPDDLSFSPNGKYLAAADASGGIRSINPDAPLTLWNVADGKILATFPEAWSPTFSPNGKYFAAYTATAPSSAHPFAKLAIALFDLTTFQKVRVFSQDSCLLDYPSTTASLPLRFTANGQELSEFCLQDNPASEQINRWNINSGQLIQQKKLPVSETTLKMMLTSDLIAQISPNTQMSALSAGHTVYLWNIASGQETMLSLKHSQEQQGEIVNYSFSPDSRMLATIDETGTTTLWDLSTKKPIGTVENKQTNATILSQETSFGAVVFSSDGKRLISILGNSGTVVDLTRQQLPLFLDIPYLTPVLAGTFSTPFLGGLAISPDSHWLVWADAGLFGYGVSVSNLSPADWVQQACKILGLSLQPCASAPIPHD